MYSVESLCYTILLRPVAYRMLPFNALVDAEVLHLAAHVLTTFIIAQDSNALVQLVLSMSVELLECGKSFALSSITARKRVESSMKAIQ